MRTRYKNSKTIERKKLRKSRNERLSYVLDAKKRQIREKSLQYVLEKRKKKKINK